LVVPLGAGCQNTNQALVDRQLEELARELRELRRDMASMDARVEDLQGQMILMDDRVRMGSTPPAPYGGGAAAQQRGFAGPERTMVAPESRAARRENLPVVELTPLGRRTSAGSSPASSMAPMGARAPAGAQQPQEEVLSFASIGPDGRVVRSSGPPPALGPDDAPPPAAPPAPKSSAARPAPRDLSGSPKQVYDRAFETFRAGDLDGAEALFRSFAEGHARHDLADNALYWWAECRYHRKDFLGALQLFQRILEEQPQGNKVPDAMVKMGLCLVNLDQPSEGARILEQVESLYPNTRSAEVARRFRAQIKGS